MSATSFSELGLRPELLRAVSEAGYTTPTPIQAKAIPVILEGKDVMGGAQTGTGKTAGFALPILHRLLPQANSSPSPARHPVRALILAPTRELAIQVEEAVKEYGKHTGLRSTCVYGGVDIRQQLPIVRGGVEILVATPGRLLDHVEQKSVNLSQVEIFVLDEADRMLDMGFIPDIKRIMALLPATAKRQNLLFSATFSNEIKKLADQLLNQPELIEVARRNTAAETVEQGVYKVPQDAKRALLTEIVKSRGLRQVLCFMRTKHGASRLARQLERDGLDTAAIHGDKTQGARLDALQAFKEAKLEVLVATDVAARGLDVDDLPLVVNYELPHVPEDYIHRIGRTGRAGASGEAISFVAPEEEKYLAEIEKLMKRKITVRTQEGFDAAEASARAAAPRSLDKPARRGETRRDDARRDDARRDDARRDDARRDDARRDDVRRDDVRRAEARSPREREPARRDGAGSRTETGRSRREQEREEAYARNPDQPLPARTGTSMPASSTLMRKEAGHGARGGKSRPVPALLMKRKAPATQDA